MIGYNDNGFPKGLSITELDKSLINLVSYGYIYFIVTISPSPHL